MIKTIILDLGGVIVPLDFEKGFAAIAGRCPYPPSEIPKLIGGTDLVAEFECGRIDGDAFIERLSTLLKLKVEREEFFRLWNSIFVLESLIPEGLLQALRKNYRMLLLSNTNILHFSMLRDAFPLLGHFDDYVLSYEVGAMKPSPKIYREAIWRARCQPAECFFTDDVATYVEAAKREGIDAVQFRSLEQLKTDLRARNVVWEE